MGQVHVPSLPHPLPIHGICRNFCNSQSFIITLNVRAGEGQSPRRPAATAAAAGAELTQSGAAGASPDPKLKSDGVKKMVTDRDLASVKAFNSKIAGDLKKIMTGILGNS